MDRLKIGDSASARVTKRRTLHDGVKFYGHWKMVARDPEGNIKWVKEAKNLITNVGLNHILDVVLAGGTPVDPWYIGLTNTAPSPAAGDTMASHVGWTENSNYDEATREAYVEVVSGAGSTNAASVATFTIDTDAQTVGGAFLASSNTKDEGASTLFAVVAFTGGDEALDDGYTIDVTYAITCADS